MPADRIALVAVHGVADQKPGETARALVDLLVTSAPDDDPSAVAEEGARRQVRYAAVSEERFNIPVDPLPPCAAAVAPRADATPRGEDRPASKAFRQSFRSDRWHPGRNAAARGDGVRAAGEADPGLATTRYLLAKHIDNGARREAYETTRIGVERRAGARLSRIDVYEMYWADLSRLSSQVPRIVTELFTMVFRLSKLGRDTVDEARAQFGSGAGADGPTPVRARLWTVVAALQATLDWLYANGLALLFLQLLLLAVMLGGFGLALAVEPTLIHRAACGTLAIAGLLWLAYRHRDRTISTLIGPFAAIALGAVPLILWEEGRPWTWTTAALVLGAVTWLNETVLRVADDRFPFVRRVGRWLWAAMLLLIAAGAWRDFGAGLPASMPAQQAIDLERLALHAWLHATLFGTEVALAAVKGWWVVGGVLLLGWFAVGWLATLGGGYESKASIATGRLGLAISLGTFLMLTMAGWALLSDVPRLSTAGVSYTPCIFAPAASAPRPAGRTPAPPSRAASAPPIVAATDAPPNFCPWDRERPRTRSPAALYLDDRYHASTAAFTALAALLIALVLYLAGMFFPSVLAELKVLVQARREAFRRHVARQRRDRASDADARRRNRRLGRWLTAGYRSLDGVVGAVAGGGVLAGILVALLYAGVFGTEFVLPARLGGNGASDSIESALMRASQLLLEPLVISAASIAAALTLLGGWLSKYAPAIRAPLDVALDVDNYFREFPRTNISRARIFSRYAALLGHLQRQGYDRIVIVAHSQGTVISAELLRLLSSDGGDAPSDGARPRVREGALPAIGLLTLGCPLRQLYAARFPTLYRWVIAARVDGDRGTAGARGGVVSGPRAADIGVERWANAFCSGDYVGRWLWSDSPNADDPVGHPMADAVDDRDGRALGRIDAYSEFVPMPPLAARIGGRRELEVCLGLGAHTHYLEPDQSTVAWLIDHLLCPREATGGVAADAPTGAPRAGAARPAALRRAARVVACGAALGLVVAALRTAASGRGEKAGARDRTPS